MFIFKNTVQNSLFYYLTTKYFIKNYDNSKQYLDIENSNTNWDGIKINSIYYHLIF